MAGNSYSVLNAMVDIVASPSKALDEIKPHTSWLWWPLLITIALTCGLLSYFYNWVDFPWLVEETIRQMPAENRAEAADAVRTFMQPSTSMWTSVAAIVVVTFIVYLLQSTYLHLANKVTTGSEVGFGQWFSLSAWTGFVSVFGALAGFIVMLMADSNQLSAESLQVLSFNSLLLHAAPGEPWFRWASSWGIINLWTIFLLSMGFARWTGSTIVKSAVIAALPWVAIFGIWAIMI
ncbi:MAG: hypothetical protein HKN57_13100 [Xanthomonadales bacterium]|nr:YIP1 family protein [Gammaproteobacteria bacterium]MBT8054894.1 YIP1 family protein [Gammaproteobacteria bacterium]NND58175.1 hypothetical protein [Xanthomonadales bacterium]NNK50032.1 hypothetical protein [Xanthomonadales bacterium]